MNDDLLHFLEGKNEHRRKESTIRKHHCFSQILLDLLMNIPEPENCFVLVEKPYINYKKRAISYCAHVFAVD